jgi:hypothetical protein
MACTSRKAKHAYHVTSIFMKKQKMSLEKMKGILSQTLSRDELKAVMAGSGEGGGSGGGQCSLSCWTWSGGPTQTQWWCHKPQGTCVCPVDPWVPCV